MHALQTLGLLLWRGGLLVAGGAVCYEVARRVLLFADVPRPLRVALGLVLGGAVLVLASLVAERVQDARAEGDLRRE